VPPAAAQPAGRVATRSGGTAKGGWLPTRSGSCPLAMPAGCPPSSRAGHRLEPTAEAVAVMGWTRRPPPRLGRPQASRGTPPEARRRLANDTRARRRAPTWATTGRPLVASVLSGMATVRRSVPRKDEVGGSRPGRPTPHSCRSRPAGHLCLRLLTGCPARGHPRATTSRGHVLGGRGGGLDEPVQSGRNGGDSPRRPEGSSSSTSDRADSPAGSRPVAPDRWPMRLAT
jgi:hypothetical protein